MVNAEQPFEDNRFCFIAEWFDEVASLNRKYSFIYSVRDSAVEMIDTKSRKGKESCLLQIL